ncbi:hypothetical protein VMCG_05224 [Cytospora schulzeri]|uniref:Protein kinase domain-containing protein n=1 Tax=Cytospora schulzeri TaxID=448051 RepID=A0A423WQN4_9PEZI|nr:hypothetical protein VMCG_05224 [Valsa malicola]
MSTSSCWPYAYHGVFLPMQNRADDKGREAISAEWPSPRGNGRRTAKRQRTNRTHIAGNGFVLVDAITLGSDRDNLLLVQSVSTGDLFMNKIVQRVDVAPLELRVSSAEYTDNPGDQDPNLQGILPQDAKWCNQLRFWQKLQEAVPGRGPAYSLYFELVAEQLCLAVAWMYFGERPDMANFRRDGPWTRIYHRDLWANNIFIHYPPKTQDCIPQYSLQSNAFPQIVLGDFGNSGMDGDPQDEGSFLPINLIPHGDGNSQELREWEDIYCIGAILRELCMSQFPEADVRRPDPNRSMASIAISSGPMPYSNRLINLLTSFEWNGLGSGQEFNDFDDPAAATVTNAQWCLDTLLPAAQQEVAARRNPPGSQSARYFQALDVSWTKPQGRMPVSYNSRYADEADPQPGQVDVDLDGVKDDEERHERSRMRRLRGLHVWDNVKPPYQLRLLEWGVPNVGLVNDGPAAADGK